MAVVDDAAVDDVDDDAVVGRPYWKNRCSSKTTSCRKRRKRRKRRIRLPACCRWGRAGCRRSCYGDGGRLRCGDEAGKVKGKKNEMMIGESLVAQSVNALSSREQKVPGSNPRGDKNY